MKREVLHRLLDKERELLDLRRRSKVLEDRRVDMARELEWLEHRIAEPRDEE